MKTLTTLALATLLVTGPAVAQDHQHAGHQGAMATSEGLPDGWMMRLDRANAAADMARFRTMSPGWHVTTGGRGAAIFWRPSVTGSGSYTATTTIHLMKPAEHAEAFGLFIGGQDLSRPGQSYLYFLVRQTGEFLIKRRAGDATENVVGWTRHQAVPVAGADGSTAYTLAVRTGATDVEFMVNGATVHSMSKSQLRTDGLVGLRVNHMLDVHVESLEVK